MRHLALVVGLILAVLILTPGFTVFSACDPEPEIVGSLPRMGAGWSGAVAIVGNLLYEVTDAVNYANIYNIDTGQHMGNIYFGSWCINDIKGFTYDPFRNTFWAKVGGYAYEVPLTGGQWISRIPINTGGLAFGIWKDPEEEFVMWVADPVQPQVRKVDIRDSSVLGYVVTGFNVRGVARVGDTLWLVRAGEPGETGALFQVDMWGNELCKYLLPQARYDHDAGGCDIDSNGYLWIEGGKGTAIYQLDVGADPEPTSLAPTVDSGDYDGDSTSDIAVFRPSSGLWAVRGVTRVYFGQSGDIPTSGDYNGDGTTDIALFRPASGLWAVRGGGRSYFGIQGDIPVPGDYTGSGTVTPGIFRSASGLWAIKGLTRRYFGTSGDIPVPYYEDLGVAKEIGIFRPATGLWASPNDRTYFGAQGDQPVIGSYGPGQYELQPGVFRPASGLWALLGATRTYFGQSGDQPVPGNYTGFTPADIGVFRPASGLWAIRGVTRAYFGIDGDIPVSGFSINPSSASVM